MSKRRHRRRDEQRRLIEEWEESGESVAAFAARIGVASNTLYRWRRAESTSAPLKVPESTLARIVEVRSAAMPADTRFEIEVGGRRVRVPASFDETGLRRLLRVLETAA
jgi:transposase-like protein